ncbi:MAG TPA: DNA recombination protein RmuC [Steroidobacteraceae bacterium]|nr:DNA recombination protein RmuC [Steroidobacteraceae bacterium]
MNSAWVITVIAALAAALIGYLIGTLRAAKHANELNGRLEAANARLSSEGELHTRTAALLAQSEAQVRAAVESASRLALDANSETFLKLAREVFGRDQAVAGAELEKREKAIAQLVEPIQKALAKQEEQSQAMERERRESVGKLSGQIESLVNVQALLQRETRNLSTALRRPEVRGRWGEITLRRVVELAGMSDRCDFEEQVNVETSDRSVVRPDLVVRMPESRSIVVDAKTPLDAYMDAVEAPDDESRRVSLARHAMQVEQRVRELGQKSYWEQFEQSPEFAVLFLPGDQFLAAALAERPDLLDTALKQRIVITTPSTLMALLKVIAYGWRQNAVTENAKEIRKNGEDIYRALTAFVSHLQKVGNSLGKAVEAYNSTIGSLERNVMPKARRFPELGITSDAPMAPVDPIEELVRKPATAPALESDSSPDTPRNPS